MNLIRWITTVLLLAVAMYLFPLFHIHNLDEIKRKQKMEQFDPETFSKEFWDNQLLKSVDKAVSLQALLPLIKSNPDEVKEQYSNTIGIGSVYYYYLKGIGYVESIEEDSVAIVLQKDNQKPDLRIITGKIFGNAIRNGCNELNVSDFPNSQEFNQVSLHLNKIVENVILPPFKKSVVLGDRVNFVGCCEILDEETDLYPLKLIPIFLKIEKGI